MNPPKVYEETIPSSHSTIKITKIVQSTAFLLSYCTNSNPSMKIGHARSLAPKSRVAGLLEAGVNPGRLPVEAAFYERPAPRAFSLSSPLSAADNDLKNSSTCRCASSLAIP